MNNKEKNRFEMIGSVYSFGEAEVSALGVIPKLSELFGDLKMIHREISLNDKLLSEGTKGKVASKEVSQTEIVNLGLVFAGALFSFAVDRDDTELMTFADINSKTIKKLRESELPVFIERILDKADAIAEGLTKYGISKEKRNAARATLNVFIERFAAVSIGKGSKSAARDNITLLFKNADKKLKVLDRLMLHFKNDNAELFNKYTAARVIYDKSGKRVASIAAKPVP